MKSPEKVVQAQLDAYNAKDIDALLGTYHPDAEQYTMHGGLVARGHAAMRPRFLARFSEPDLHATLLHRAVVGNFVMDHERVTRNLPEGRGEVEMLCVYEVLDGLIVKASFAFAEPVRTGGGAARAASRRQGGCTFGPGARSPIMRFCPDDRPLVAANGSNEGVPLVR